MTLHVILQHSKMAMYSHPHFQEGEKDFVFREPRRVMDRITVQVLMPQEASGSNQCDIKSRRGRRSSIRQEGDARRRRLEKIA